jgi:hypothetical protein
MEQQSVREPRELVIKPVVRVAVEVGGKLLISVFFVFMTSYCGGWWQTS